MRFRTKERPRGLLRATHQRRLTLMVAGVGLILLCFTVVRNPAFWSGLFPESISTAEEAAGKPVVPAHTEDARPVLAHDEVLVGRPAGESESGQLAEAPTTVSTKRIPYAQADQTPNISAGGIPQVPAELLKDVRDDVIGIHSREAEAYYAAIKLASKVEQRSNLQAPAGAYALFMDSPNGSRGIAWEIKGQLRRLSQQKGRTTAFGVSTLYDAWITTADSGDHLVHVVAVKADKSLLDPRGGTMVGERTVEFPGPEAPDVRFTGYFFKREGYASRNEDGVSLAPLFVAGTIHEVPPPDVASSRAEELTPYLGWLTVAICVGIALMVWSFTASDAAHAQTRTHQLTRLPAHATFDDVAAVTVDEALRQLQHVDGVDVAVSQ